MLVGGHPGDFVQAEVRGRRSQHAGALQRTADAAPADDGEHPAVDETGDVPVQAAGRHVRELSPKLGRGQRSIAEEGLHDAQPDRVEKQVSASHKPNLDL